MNWKTLGIVSGVAAMALATPATVSAQRGGGRGGAMGAHGSSFGGGARSFGGGTRMGAAGAMRPSANTQFGNRGGNTFNRTPVNRTGNNTGTQHGDHNWHHDGYWRNHRWYCNNNYYYYGGFGYPYYGYGFGYPYGFGYGYGFGYPYYGGVSATFYADNNRYSERTYQGGDGSVTARVQQRLARAGYYHGTIDGVAGSGTRSAIRAYERAHGLPVDGQIDSELLSRMGLS